MSESNNNTSEIKFAVLFACVALSGCENKPTHTYDQTLRREVFIQCLEKAPAGPVATKYNDWSEVVDECSTAAQYISLTSDMYVQREPRGETK